MTATELISKVLSANKPIDIFPTDDWKKDYIQYCKLIHPDICKLPNANDAMAKLTEYKLILEGGTTFTDETGNFKIFDKKIEYIVTDANRALLRKSFNNFKILKDKKDKASLGFHRYLPESMRWETSKIDKSEKLVILLKDRSIPLSNQKLPQIHTNWIFSRMFEFTLWLRQINYVHLGLNPTTVFVVPETHGIIVISFYHMTEVFKKATTISAKYKMWYPTTLFSEKFATPDVDLELCKKITIYLLGDKSAAGTKLKMNKDINANVLNFLLTKHQNDIDEYKQYREIISKNFEKKFYPLDI
jgi:hypothetical protein